MEESAPLQNVANRMLKDKISALLVRNEHGLIHGILTTDDLLKALVSLLSKAPGGQSVTLKDWSDWQGWKLDSFLV